MSHFIGRARFISIVAIIGLIYFLSPSTWTKFYVRKDDGSQALDLNNILNTQRNQKGDNLPVNDSSSRRLDLSYQTKTIHWQDRVITLRSDVNIVPSTLPKGEHLKHEDCVPLPKSPKEGVRICLHPVKDDIYISAFLSAGILWEEDRVLAMGEALEAEPHMILVDIGSNIGQYTLWAAAKGHKVVAVEMLMDNVRLLQKSTEVSGLDKQVVIVNNAVYSDRRVLGTKFLIDNIGGSRLNVSQSTLPLNTSLVSVPVRTICMDDLVPLLEDFPLFVKMDIERSEHFALGCAHEFFRKLHVTVVQMEWQARSAEESDVILKFMEAHGYHLSLKCREYVPIDFKHMPLDVYFIKK